MLNNRAIKCCFYIPGQFQKQGQQWDLNQWAPEQLCLVEILRPKIRHGSIIGIPSGPSTEYCGGAVVLTIESKAINPAAALYPLSAVVLLLPSDYRNQIVRQRWSRAKVGQNTDIVVREKCSEGSTYHDISIWYLPVGKYGKPSECPPAKCLVVR